MDEKIKYSLLIERYINGEMDEKEARAFLQELANNKDLAREFHFELELSKAISDDDMIEFRHKLNKVLRESKRSTPVLLHYLSSRPYQIAAAASVIILIAAAFLFFLTPVKTSNDRLFSTYYDADQPLRITRSDNDLMEALRSYQTKDYSKAIEQFNVILKTNPGNSSVRFYTAISYIETKKFDQAITYFSDIVINNNSAYQKPSEWFLGLCYLKVDQKDKAIELFQHIAIDEGHDYQQDARLILEKINHLK